MLASLVIALAALAGSAAAAPTERQNGWYWPGLPDDVPWFRVTCYTHTGGCRNEPGNADYTFDSRDSLTKGCTQVPRGMKSCRLERFPQEEGGVPEDNSCRMNLYWRYRNDRCERQAMEISPVWAQWGWTCGRVWGGDIQGYSVDCTGGGGGGMNRAAGGVIKGENAEGVSGIGGE